MVDKFRTCVICGERVPDEVHFLIGHAAVHRERGEL